MDIAALNALKPQVESYNQGALKTELETTIEDIEKSRDDLSNVIDLFLEMNLDKK